MELYIKIAIGGMLMGLATGIMLIVRGRILGCSGMIFRSITLSVKGIDVDSVLFVIGLFISGLGFYLYQNIPNPNAIFHTSLWLFLVGGIFTGIGTSIGNGCTSGHGLCGLALISKRSILAVCIFFPVAMITSWLIH